MEKEIWQEGQIVLITEIYPNGKRHRQVGVIKSISEREPTPEGKVYVHLIPLPANLAKPIREKYCTEEYNHQGIENCYSDQYGFACWYVHPKTTIILGTYKIPSPAKMWYPSPGNKAYDLMC